MPSHTEQTDPREARPDPAASGRDAPLITIGLVTDLHYAPTVMGTRHCRDSLEKLQQAVDTFRARQPDLVIDVGDSIDTCDTLEEELARLGQVTGALSSLPMDVHYLVGNHDVAELTMPQFLEACRRGDGPQYYSFDCRGVHIVMLDSLFNPDGSHFSAGNFHWADAWLGEDQVAWLKADLAAARPAPVLVFCHGNLDDRVRGDGSLNAHIARDAAAVREVLEDAGSVKAVIQGHDHAGHKAIINGIPYIILEAMVEGPAPEGNAYAMLSLMADGGITLEGFGQQPSMQFSPEH